MKKIPLLKAGALLLAAVFLLLLLAGCFRSDSGISTTEDGAVFRKRLTYSWDPARWIYAMRGDFPELSCTEDGIQYTFAVLAYDCGMAEDLRDYLLHAAEKRFGKDVDVHLAAGSPDKDPMGQGYLCYQGGISDWEEYGFTLAGTIFSLTDGENSAVIGVFVHGQESTVRAMTEANYAGDRDNGVFTAPAADILASFRFCAA